MWAPVFGHRWFERTCECKNSRKRAIHSFWITGILFSPDQSVKSDQAAKDVAQEWLKGDILRRRNIRRHDRCLNALGEAVQCRYQPTCCNEDIFENSLNAFYTPLIRVLWGVRGVLHLVERTAQEDWRCGCNVVTCRVSHCWVLTTFFRVKVVLADRTALATGQAASLASEVSWQNTVNTVLPAVAVEQRICREVVIMRH